MQSGVFARQLSGRVYALYKELSVNKEILIVSNNFLSVFVCCVFGEKNLHKGVLTGLLRAQQMT